jgi:hypothetical protein
MTMDMRTALPGLTSMFWGFGVPGVGAGGGASHAAIDVQELFTRGSAP